MYFTSKFGLVVSISSIFVLLFLFFLNTIATDLNYKILSTVLDIKRVENAFFTKFMLLTNITYQNDPQSLLLNEITLIMHHMTVT